MRTKQAYLTPFHRMISFHRAILFFTLVALILTACASSNGENTAGTTQPTTAPLSVYIGTQSGSSNGVVVALAAKTGAVRWKYQTSVTFLTLALSGDAVYVAGSDLTTASGGGVVSALRASDGAVLWQRKLGSAGLSAPVIAQGVIYLASSLDGMVYALHGSDGSLLWQTDVRRALAQGGEATPDLQTPVVVNGQVYVPGARRLYVLQANTGKMRWIVEPAQPLLSALQVRGDTAYVLGSDKAGQGARLHAFNVADASERWSFAHGSDGLSFVATAGGTVYVSASSGGVYALRSTDGKALWYAPLGKAGSAAHLLVSDATLVSVNTEDGEVTALRADSGARLWHMTPSSVPAQASVIDAQMLYVLSGPGETLYGVSRSNGSSWHISLSDTPSFLNTLQVVQGLVYVMNADAGTVSATRGSDGSPGWQYRFDAPDPGVVLPMVSG